MRKASIFYGEPETGKSRKAREIAKGRNFIWMNGCRIKDVKRRFYFSRVANETDLIIVDDLPDGFDFGIFYNHISDDRFYYEVQRKGFQSIPTPEFIFITNEKPKFKGSSFEKRFELVEFKL